MNDFLPTECEKTIILDGTVKLEDYKTYWRDSFFKTLPNTLIFWGTLAGGALFFAFLLRGDLFGFSLLLFSLLIAAIPVLMTVYSYQSFMSATKKHLAALSENERHFNLIIKPGGKGIEYMQGENFTSISWNSIRGAVEREKYFSLDYRATPFLIMKSEFSDDADIRLFRATLADRFGSRAKLLR